jgi:hypothetical protein
MGVWRAAQNEQFGSVCGWSSDRDSASSLSTSPITESGEPQSHMGRLAPAVRVTVRTAQQLGQAN